MAVRIRLTRVGKKKKALYRVVVANGSTPRDGRFLEVVGYYNPAAEVSLEVKEDRVTHWLSVGAQPSETVRRLLAGKGLVKAVERKSSSLGVSKKDRKASAA